MTPRRIVRRSSLVVAALGGLWALFLMISGGVNATIFGMEVRAHAPFRPLLLSLLALVTFVLSGGDLSPVAGVARRVARLVAARSRRAASNLPSARVCAWALAIGITVLACVYGTRAVGGSDSYGYLSQAELWSRGALKVRQPFAKDVPWPSALWSFTPLGYSVLHVNDGETIVPVYSPGLPMLMAGVKLMAGYQAMFFVVPILSGLLVIATYGLGRRLASPSAGLIGAWLVATSPAVLFMMTTTMTDVPVAGVWTAAFYLLLGASGWSAAAAGLAASIAILIRPNLVPLAAVMGLYYVFKLFDRRTRRDAVRFGTLFVLGLLPSVVAVALINRYLFGSPFVSGYGRLSFYFSWSHVIPNLRSYLLWLAESQTPVALVGLAAALIPTRRLWSGLPGRSGAVVAALFVLTLWSIYFLYQLSDAWWYLRFLLASWPFIMIGTGTVAVQLMRWRPRAMTPIVGALILALGAFQVHVAASRDAFDIWTGERRYVVAARMVQQLTEPDSVVLAGQHSGSVRLYGGRMTLTYYHLDPGTLDSAVDWLNARSIHTYLLLEEWEVTDIKTRFAGQHTLQALDRPPLAIYEEPGWLVLFDLSRDRGASAVPQMWTGTYRSPWAPALAPPPTLTFAR